jgi:hypothetical protein
MKRHPEVRTMRIKALGSNRHDHHIHHKVKEWFKLMGEQLRNPDILPENVYNMNETGVLLSVLSTLKVLVSSDLPRPCRKAGVKRTVVTAIECISADGRSLPPLIIWRATTQSKHMDDLSHSRMAFRLFLKLDILIPKSASTGSGKSLIL